MAISDLQTIVCSPGRNYVTLRIETSDGIVGLGDATLNGRELSVASYLREHVAPLLIGRDENSIEDTWQYLYRSPYWRRGPVTMAALAAVDMALWDIKARAANLPLFQLLGGPSRSGLLTYVHASGQNYAQLAEAISGYLEQGFSAVRFQIAVPGLDKIYGVQEPGSASDETYEPAQRTPAGGKPWPIEESWDPGPYMRHIPSVFERLRADFGPDCSLLHDVHHRLTPQQAARFARSVEDFDPFWLEDLTPVEDPAALRLARGHSVAPLAVGEVLNSVYDYTGLIPERLVDFVRSSPTHAGGITGLRKILAFAEVYGIRSGMHGPSDVSPIGMAAALHLGLSIHNFGIQEYMPHPPEALQVFGCSFRLENGYLHPGDAPGLGVSFDESAAEQFGYQPAYLPVSRLRDGTVHDW